MNALCFVCTHVHMTLPGGFPGVSTVQNPPANTGDAGLIPGWGKCPGEGNGNPLQYSCLENPRDRGAWRARWGHKELDTTEQPNNTTTRLLSLTQDEAETLTNALLFSPAQLLWIPVSPAHLHVARVPHTLDDASSEPRTLNAPVTINSKLCPSSSLACFPCWRILLSLQRCPWLLSMTIPDLWLWPSWENSILFLPSRFWGLHLPSSTLTQAGGIGPTFS